MTFTDATRRQHDAIDGGVSVWASANAGTGKTTVLIHRLLGLLLCDPALQPRQILALTFTRAAAAEMASRFAALVHNWSVLDEDALAVRVRETLGIDRPGPWLPRMRSIALQVGEEGPLFSTIHGLAQRLVARMPYEAGLPEGFTVLDDSAQRRLLREVQNTLLTTVSGELADFLGILLDELGEQGWRELTDEIVRVWPRLLEVVGQAGGQAALLARIDDALQLPPDDELWAPLLPTPEEWRVLQHVADVLPQRQDVQNVLNADGAAREDEWRLLLLTKAGEVRLRLFTKAEKQLIGEAALEVFMAAAERIQNILRARQAAHGRDLTAAWLVWAQAVFGAYQARKSQLGMVDYDDLLQGLRRVFALVERGGAAWLWHQLDQTYRHLVLDEAQDNNALQGELMQWLARHVLAGDVGGGARTVLAVGDMKQSIFRFQGAVPENFLTLRGMIQQWAGDAYRPVAMTTTFRNGAAIVRAVDAVLGREPMAQAILGSVDEPWPAHLTAATRPSRVDVWPLVQSSRDSEQVAPWALPEERYAATVHSAKMVAIRQLAEWLVAQQSRGVMMPSTGRPLRWQDVMIVVQTNQVAGLVAGVLRQYAIPVAATRGILPPVVADVVALLRWVFNPADHVALAHILRGFYAWDEDQLMVLGFGALGRWDERLQGVEAADLQMFAALNSGPPARLVHKVVTHYGLDIHRLAALMNWAEACETLRDLIARLERDVLPVAIPPGEAGVRILTVQGAKGLEAPLVILPQTDFALDDMRQDTLLWGQGVMLYKKGSGTSAFEDGLIADEKQRKRADALRGLYVAMTRAKDWLVVTGWDNRQTRNVDTWHRLIGEGVRTLHDAREESDIVSVGDDFAVEPIAPVAPEQPAPPPTWVFTPVARDAAPIPPTMEQLRGEWTHALLQGAQVTIPMAERPSLERAVAAVRVAYPWIFGPHSRFEVPLRVMGADGHPQLGRADAVVWHADAWWVLDFKTGVPQDPLPEAYRSQVRRYMDAVSAVYPNDTVCGAVVWVASAQLVDV
jgi:ATP-dependent helicase/nuclease subunit A